MSSQIPSDALATLNALQTEWDKAEAQTGGQEWPPDGDRECTLINVELKAVESMKRVNNEPKGGQRLTFTYVWPGEEDPTTGSPARQIEFRGRPFKFFNDNSWMSEGQRGHYLQREMARLKGHITKILDLGSGQPPAIADAVQEIMNRIEADEEISLKLRIESGEKTEEGRVFPTEYVLANVTGG